MKNASIPMGNNKPLIHHKHSSISTYKLPINPKQQNKKCQSQVTKFCHTPDLNSIYVPTKALQEKEKKSQHTINYLKKNYTNTPNCLLQTIHNIPTAPSNHPLELSISTHQIQVILSTYKVAHTIQLPLYLLLLVPQSPTYHIPILKNNLTTDPQLGIL